jgi:hypothetical protein
MYDIAHTYPVQPVSVLLPDKKPEHVVIALSVLAVVRSDCSRWHADRCHGR